MSSPIPQSSPPSDDRPGLSVSDLLYWHDTLSNLNLSMDDARRLSNGLQGRAYVLYGEKEAPRIQHGGPSPMLALRQYACDKHKGPLSPSPPDQVKFGKLPTDKRIPSRHNSLEFNNFVFVYPEARSRGPFYVVTRGLLVGVFALWTNVAPFVSRVKGAAYIKVKSIEEGGQIILDAIEDKTVQYLD